MKTSMLILATLVNSVSAEELSLWYRQPANPAKWEQAVPIGNGRLGAMIAGGIDKDVMIINEDTLWSGWSEPNNDRAGSYEALVKIRRILKQNGDPNSAKKIAMKDFCSLYGYGKPDFGAFQPFCNTVFTFGHAPASVSDYRRDLDLRTAVATVSYKLDGVKYSREYFASYPDNVVVMRLSADRKKQVSFELGATSQHKDVKISASHELVLNGQISTGNEKHPGMTFQAIWRVIADGGTVAPNDDGTRLVVKDADSVVIIMAAATNYKLEYPTYKGEEPDRKNRQTLDLVKSQSFRKMYKKHVADYDKLFSRVDLELSGTSRDDLPTDKRLESYKKNRDDRGLEELIFQYGRYLMIASSRPGCMPANLQGLWNKSMSPAWNCDYHMDINLQMNYWPVDSCNLSECADPLVEWVTDLTEPGAKTAKVHYKSRGWIVHIVSNVWGYTPPGPRRGVHMLEPAGSAFICQNIWDHYAFTGDREYLEKSAYPILKGAAEFWVDNLQETADGCLAVSPSYSPEQGPLSDGAYYQTMIVWDLFDNCIRATEALGKDKAFAAELQKLKDRIQKPKVGKYGQLSEWRNPDLEKNVRSNKHRHVSPMYAVYPGKQILLSRDKKLTDAAIQLMNFRGDSATGWSMGWKINLWARLLDGNRAHKLIQNFLSGRTYDNLWCAHPPFQIDGNFGYTAGVAEMLIQSHAGEVVLLPALPDVWHSGSVKGLCARGGFVVDINWKAGKLISVTMHSRTGTECTVRLKDSTKKIKLKQGETIQLAGKDFR